MIFGIVFLFIIIETFILIFEFASLCVWGLPYRKLPKDLIIKEVSSSRLNTLAPTIISTKEGYISSIPVSIFGKYVYRNFDKHMTYRIPYGSSIHKLIKAKYKELS